jgi:nickel-dependent lactate racemase
MVIGKGLAEGFLSETETRDLMATALEQARLDGKRVLVIIPDRTRTAPMPLMFRLFFELLGNRVARLDFLIALGTHKPLSEDSINELVGVSAEERAGRYRQVNILNHRWDRSEIFVSLGQITAAEVEQLTGGLMSDSIE